jgi:hypothetical protein
MAPTSSNKSSKKTVPSNLTPALPIVAQVAGGPDIWDTQWPKGKGKRQELLMDDRSIHRSNKKSILNGARPESESSAHHAEGLVDSKVRAQKKVTDLGYPRARTFRK